MKHVLPYILAWLAATALAPAARAQWTVYDPAVHSQQILSTAQEIAKFVEVINNQVSQLDQLTEQVATLHHYVDLFGDPGAVVPEAIGALTAELSKTELGQNLGALQAAADATAAMLSDGAGLYRAVGEVFSTPGGAVIQRRPEPYRPVAAIQQTAANYLAVAKDAAGRRVELKKEIGLTVEALRAATTDAEVQKLTGVLMGLATALDGAGQEVTEAMASALVQDIANRADRQRQMEALKEQQHAEFREAIGRYGEVFPLMNQPTLFPTK
ncbi:MAG: hypothetical protein KF791_09665 [Verrucomicrobiae bacterium]|nr:hypothetical protein [Verrucomicrobiae bacterium]